jgi:hypothetical protein
LRRSGLQHSLVGDDVTSRGKCDPADFLRVGDLNRGAYRRPVPLPFEKCRAKKEQQQNDGAGFDGSFSREDAIPHYFFVHEDMELRFSGTQANSQKYTCNSLGTSQPVQQAVAQTTFELAQ